MIKLADLRIKDPRFLLMYSALQFGPQEMAKPDGSLSLPYVAGALRRNGYAVRILDVSVGAEQDKLDDTFFKPTQLSTGLIRCGMSKERIAQEIAAYDVIGVSSIFTAQTSMVLELVRLVKEVDASKLVIAGGVNARNMKKRFFNSGVDIIVLSEAENTIVEIAAALRGERVLTAIPGIAYRTDRGDEVVNNQTTVLRDLDQLPMPAWDLLPLEKYWDISRPHGGDFPLGKRVKYAMLQTSRGCPYHCLYCHISKEEASDPAGAIGNLRLKSVERVMQEIQTLKDLGAEYLFFEDDSLLAKKERAFTLFRLVKKMGLHLSDVNGINISHLHISKNGQFEVDQEFLEALADAGFHMLHLPFETANKRLLDKYSTSKWSIEKTDAEKLIRACDKVGIKVAGNYMIGYPEETLEEVYNTILMAKRHVEYGMNHIALFNVVPFPGSRLYDLAIESGHFDPDFDPDQMKWTKSIMTGLCVPTETLEHIRRVAWLTINHSSFVNYKLTFNVLDPNDGTPS